MKLKGGDGGVSREVGAAREDVVAVGRLTSCDSESSSLKPSR